MIYKIAQNKDRITQREREVLSLIAYEYSTKQIAYELHVSYETALSHRKNLLMSIDLVLTPQLTEVLTPLMLEADPPVLFS